MIKPFLINTRNRYRLWKCRWFDHTPNHTTMERRERMPDWPYPGLNTAACVDWNREHHYERYTTCLVCDKEITYVRWFNFWGTKTRLVDRNIREWLDREDADKVEVYDENYDENWMK